MNYAITELEDHLHYLAKAINGRADGAAYIPIFERVERELERLKMEASALERVREIAKSQRSGRRLVKMAA